VFPAAIYTTNSGDAPDIRPDNPAFFDIRYLSGRIPDFTAGYPVRPDTGYPANVDLILLSVNFFYK
jgi:hypothetical protein